MKRCWITQEDPGSGRISPVRSTERTQGKYRNDLGVRNIEIFESVAWAEMEALGYPLDSTHEKTFTNLDIRLYRTHRVLAKKILEHGSKGRRIPDQSQGQGYPSNSQSSTKSVTGSTHGAKAASK